MTEVVWLELGEISMIKYPKHISQTFILGTSKVYLATFLSGDVQTVYQVYLEIFRSVYFWCVSKLVCRTLLVFISFLSFQLGSSFYFIYPDRYILLIRPLWWGIILKAVWNVDNLVIHFFNTIKLPFTYCIIWNTWKNLGSWPLRISWEDVFVWGYPD